MFDLSIKTLFLFVAFSSTVFASIDISSSTSTPFTIATESFDEDDFDDGLLLLLATNESFLFTTDFNISTKVGFSVGIGTTRFARFDLTGAKFGLLNPVIDSNSGSSGFNGTIAAGGIDETFVIFELSDTSTAIQRDDILDLSVLYNAKTDQDVVATYRLYDTAIGAVNELPEFLLSSESATLFQFSSGLQSNFSESNNLVAISSSNFTEFDVSTTETSSSVIGELGSINVNDIVVPGSVNARSWPTEIETFIDTTLNSASVTIVGDFSVGVFSVSESACGVSPQVNPAILLLNSSNTQLTVTPVDITQELLFCVDVSGLADNDQQIQPGEYTISISTLNDGVNIDDEVGEVSYNTTSIEVPFITIFSDYNQRIFIVNKSANDALYSVYFVSEEGVSYIAGEVANGIAVANQVTLIRTSELVEVTGGTRITAVIEIELDDVNVSAVTQIVNNASGEIETIILN